MPNMSLNSCTVKLAPLSTMALKLLMSYSEKAKLTDGKNSANIDIQSSAIMNNE
jgi:hypothetical protein